MTADSRDEVPCGMCGHVGHYHVQHADNPNGRGARPLRGALRFGGCSYALDSTGGYCKCLAFIDPPKSAGPPPNCHACAYSFMEPDDDLTCGHPDAGSMGLYVHHAAAPDGHCGPTRPKFKQHPGRHPSGHLKSLGSDPTAGHGV